LAAWGGSDNADLLVVHSGPVEIQRQFYLAWRLYSGNWSKNGW
jgi:hypothetical protein